MMTDTNKTGFIVTYFKTAPESEQLLTELIKTISRMDVYLVLASHTPDVPLEVQRLCDFYFYQELNVVDNRKYSHGVAENNLIELSLRHLQWVGIEWTYKITYDCVINDITRFYEWKLGYKYDFVSCNWGSYYIATNSFFANVNFILNNITFYKTIDSMFAVSNVLEQCWQHDIDRNNLKNRVFTFSDKYEFYGESNKIDSIGHDYHKLDFWYSADDNRFYVANNGLDFKGKVKIFDYYSDVCLYNHDNFEHSHGVVMWFIPPFSEAVKSSKNGWYVEYYFSNMTVRSNYGIQDFTYRDPLHKSFATFKWSSDMKYHEYVGLSDFNLYKNDNFNIQTTSFRNYVDVGANFGMSSVYAIKNGIRCYLIDPDERNVKIMTDAFSKNSKVKIYPYAVCELDGYVDFYVNETKSDVSSIYQTDDSTCVRVPAITPNTLIEQYIDEDYIDYMKIDIEGAEYKFFETISDYNLKKIRKMIIEFHHNDDYQVLGILKKLAKCDFKFKLDTWGSYVNSFIIENKMGIIYAWR